MGTNKKYNKVDVLRYIIAYKQNNDGCSPSYRDICDALGINSTSTVSRYLDELKEDGSITMGDSDRSIQVKGGSWSILYDGIEGWMTYNK